MSIKRGSGQTTTLIGLYTMLGFVIITSVYYLGVSLNFAVGVGIGFILLNFVLGPFLMDLSLRWFYKISWCDLEELPKHLQDFINNVCEKHRLRVAKFGIIEDSTPQAFTYGHTPRNGRIVITRGIFEMLNPEEIEAVIAHEMGHIRNWDIALMTLMQLVPLILFYLYESLNESEKARGALALIAYGLYMLSELVVLGFSRIREYHADRFSANETGNPRALSSALVKISYGMIKNIDRKSKTANLTKGAFATMGIASVYGSSISLEEVAEDGTSYTDKLADILRWDLESPWAKIYELASTHPLVAKRLKMLALQAQSMHQEPYIQFPKLKPYPYWFNFFTEFFLQFTPSLILIVGSLFLFDSTLFQSISSDSILGLACIAFGAIQLINYFIGFGESHFIKKGVTDLLGNIKVSGIRSEACILKGKIIGRGQASYIFGGDLMFQDETGLIFLRYKQPLDILESIFGLFKADKFIGNDVTVTGWYFRTVVPYVMVNEIVSHSEKTKSYYPIFRLMFTLGLIAFGIYFMF